MKSRLVCKVTEPGKNLEIPLILLKNFSNKVLWFGPFNLHHLQVPWILQLRHQNLCCYDRSLFHMMMVSLRPLVSVPGEELPYMGDIGKCGPKGYSFVAVWVINRVSKVLTCEQAPWRKKIRRAKRESGSRELKQRRRRRRREQRQVKNEFIFYKRNSRLSRSAR